MDGIPRSRGHWGPPWRLPITPTLGQTLPQSSLAGLSFSPFCPCGLAGMTPPLPDLSSRAGRMMPAWSVSLFHPLATMIGSQDGVWPS